MSSGCEVRPRCLVWTTKYTNKSTQFFLRNHMCHLTFFDTISNSDRYMYSLLIEADREFESNYRASVSLEHGDVTGLTASGVFGHSHPSPQTIWEYAEDKIEEVFPDYLKSSVPFKFVLSFTSTTPGEHGKAVEPTLHCAQNDKSVKKASCTYSCLESLSGDFSKLLDEGSDPDVEFQCADYSAKAHKSILCARSPVFAAMLNSDMVESKTGLVKIRDMTAGIFEKFLRYLYTGSLDKLTVDTATGLYEAGDKYSVKALTTRCAEFLADNLAVDNACEVLVLSHAHSDETLTDAATAYILAKKIYLMDDRWPDFCKSHPQIAVEVLNRYCKLTNNVPQ